MLPAEHSNALRTAAIAVLIDGQFLLVVSALVTQLVRAAAALRAALLRCPAQQSCFHRLRQEMASENILSLALWMEVITSIVTQEPEVDRKRTFVWVVREKKGRLSRQGSESANHTKPVLCQAGNN